MLLLSACLIRQDVYEERLAYLQDADGDGYVNVESGGDDCDDSDATIHPDAEEIARDDLDQDCDGASRRPAWPGLPRVIHANTLCLAVAP